MVPALVNCADGFLHYWRQLAADPSGLGDGAGRFTDWRVDGILCVAVAKADAGGDGGGKGRFKLI